MEFASRGYRPLSGPDNIELSEIPAKQPTSREVVDEADDYDMAPTTRWLAIGGLATSWILGIACIISGSGAVTKPTISAATKSPSGSTSGSSYHNWPQLDITPITAEILPLLASFIVTVLMEATGLIHSTTLRWALKDRLVLNSNLRLFTSARKYFCFSIASNALYATFIILSYAAASLMFAISPSDSFCEHFSGPLGSETDNGCGGVVTLATPALCCLGVGLVGQACLATWQMISVKVPTWSANPLDTAWASANMSTRTRVPQRCMMSVHDTELPPGPQRPNLKQFSIWKAHKESRRIMYYIWSITVLSYVWFGITQGTLIRKAKDGNCNGCNAYPGSNWNLIPDHGTAPTSAAIIVEFTSRFYVGMFALVCIFQGFLTLALHCAELITTLSRDERTWRQCYSSQPYNVRPNALLRAATSWISVTLFLLKAVLHWLFGKGMTYAYNWGIFLRPPQLLYLSIGATILAAFTTFLSFNQLSGNQPATFGHVQTLVDVVDEWHLLLFWGDKGLSLESGDIRHAGTASVPLGTIITDALYEGD